MKKLRNACALVGLFLATALPGINEAADCAYLLGEENLEIPRFGGDTPSTPIQAMANTLLRFAPRQTSDVYQVAISVNLEFNAAQPEQFGDGQKNAFATFGPLKNAPCTAILKRPSESSEKPTLAVVFSKEIPGFSDIKEVEFSIDGQEHRAKLTSEGYALVPVDLHALQWDRLGGAKPVFYRPVGWNDWFSVQFPDPYLKRRELLVGMRPSSRVLPDGRSVVDPLGLRGARNPQEALKEMNGARVQDFPLARAERVHGSYQHRDGSITLTSSGGVWTRYRVGDPFKIVYLAKDARDLEAEKREGVVSGTGPHFIGATAEVILNTIEAESLMTFYGFPNPTIAPKGGRLAWGLTHQWVGTWLKPGEVFVTPQGLYHWHLNHLTRPIAAQVFTPPEVPSLDNFYGFPK